MKILIIEDDKIKIEKLTNLLHNYSYELKESFQSGLEALRNNKYDLLILDMTIPLWEKENNDINQNYEQFGGERILREMKRKKIIVPVILFTMFDKFPIANDVMTFEEISAKYKENFYFYIDAVYYDSRNDDWKNNLLSLIENI
ncbi:MAG: hypothetical protein BGO88_01135 [Flavobacterium sp. 38-13]|uniref:response regulator n=1 Tax=Flavobacterium sp. 38-13 TaxID=1896168 RepID=UPI0009657917|nr:response regulator [Flavobacterium sp. 38-13]OJX49155.1 MAG: hypothetical protein BGO88_01135 [Flavobacterium sp. 38-13]